VYILPYQLNLLYLTGNKPIIMRTDLAGILGYFNVFMAFFYVFAGSYLVFSDLNFLAINKIYRIILGIVIIVYGFYRIYRAFKSNRLQK